MSILENKTAVVTGAGRGIGRAIALGLARQGANIVVTARTKSEIERVKYEVEQLGRRALAIPADVSSEFDAGTVCADAVREFGGIDILVNNAGIGSFARVAELPVEDFDRMWAVNMRGVFLLTRAAIPVMSKQHSGDIINISSLAGRNAFIGGAGYAATKWALIGFARCLMLEVREFDIRVMTLCPGSVDTTFGGPSGSKPGSRPDIPSADDVARAAIDTLLMPRHVMISEIDIRPTNPKK
jgi:3-oxoacyl-[acyl-carrier protein] reductase